MIFHDMNIRSIADKIGMDYDTALEDFCGDVSAISSKLLSFPEDNSIDALEAAVDSKDTETGLPRNARRWRRPMRQDLKAHTCLSGPCISRSHRYWRARNDTKAVASAPHAASTAHSFMRHYRKRDGR